MFGLKSFFRAKPAFPSRPYRDDAHISGEYWEKIRIARETDEFYALNSWLLDHEAKILSRNPGTVLEIGCGNGRFIREISSKVDRAIGIDWAFTRSLSKLPDNVEFIKADAVRDDIPTADLICSGDVLEHFRPEQIIPLVEKFARSAPMQYHVVACYDDNHSHLTVCPPEAWLAQMRQVDPNFHIVRSWTRRNDAKQVVFAAANFPC